MGTSHGIKQKKKKTADIQIIHPIHNHKAKIYECQIEHFIGWLDSKTTVSAFYDKITRNDTVFLCDINRPASPNQKTLLHLACDAQNFIIVRALCDAGANVNARTKFGLTPLDFALKHHHPEMVKYLIGQGGYTLRGISTYLKTDSKDNDNISLLQDYLRANDIQDYRYPFTTPYSSNNLVKFIRNDKVDYVKSILENSKINLCDDYISPSPVLHLAILNGSLPMVQLLVKHGVLIIEDDWGFSCSELARRHYHFDIADFLDITQKNRYKCIKDHANFHQKYSLLLMGFFADNRDVARKIIKDTLDLESEFLNSVPIQ